MSVPRPDADPNVNLYGQLKRDVLQRLPHVTLVTYEPNTVVAKRLTATFDPNRLDPPTGPDAPTLAIEWYRQTPHDWFRVNYHDPNTGFHAGWHQDEDHSELGRTHFQYATPDDGDRWGVTFEHETTPSLILWEIVEDLLETVIPTYAP